jgi:Ca2+-binding RTX toxin-like protein
VTLNPDKKFNFTHVYATSGTYTLTVTVTDNHGAFGTSTKQVKVSAVLPVGDDLYIGGTNAGDIIVINPTDSGANSVQVTINGILQQNPADQTFTFKPSGPSGWMVVHGLGGNDVIQLVTKKFGSATAWVPYHGMLFGDEGDDSIDTKGSLKDNVLVGGVGNDNFVAGSGRDILIGGSGADVMYGGGGDDILIGGWTDYDNDLVALDALSREWSSGASYATRVSHLKGPAGGGTLGGLNDPYYYFNTTTVHDDAAVDSFFGEAGTDWFLHSPSDKFNDWVSGEEKTLIQP